MIIQQEKTTMNRGVILALSAYIFWGVHPIYWKWLDHVPAVEILSHRIVWSCVFFGILIHARKNGSSLIRKLRQTRRPWILFVPALLIGSNWGVYIWAVNADYIIETSLGYFICPLVSVVLGVVFLNEHLRRLQWLAVLTVATGVCVMTVKYGHFPWIALYLAATWGAYGLLRKQSPLGPVEGLALEMGVLSLPALIYQGTLAASGTGVFGGNLTTSVLLIGAGVISGAPLLVFIAGSRLIRLSLVGILQYVYPTMIFLIGYLMYKEPLNEARLAGFLFVWMAVLLYVVSESFSQMRKRTSGKWVNDRKRNA